jgi:hypothetical protein
MVARDHHHVDARRQCATDGFGHFGPRGIPKQGQAEQGEYATRDVVRDMTMFLQGGSLGWRGSECCITPTSDEFAHDQFVRF